MHSTSACAQVVYERTFEILSPLRPSRTYPTLLGREAAIL